MAQLPESDYEDVVFPKETMPRPKDMICAPPNDPASLCSVRHGPAWYFDKEQGYLYLRVVNFVCYSVKLN